MALKAPVTRFFSLTKSTARSIPHLTRLLINSPIPSPPFSAAKSSAISPPTRAFCSNRNPKLVNFSPPSDSDSDSEAAPPNQPDKSKLPPPYNPFDKKPAIEEPEDPKNLQEVFAKIRSDGLMNSAVKMFDGLSQDGLTHEALELFAQIKDKGRMPDVVAHTAVLEAYADARQAKEAHKTYKRMLASGVLPNAYTYRVIIKALAESGDAGMAKDARKYVGEMVGQGMRPNAATVVAAFEGLAAAGMEEDGREMLETVKEMMEEGKVREALKGKRGVVFRTVMSVLHGK